MNLANAKIKLTDNARCVAYGAGNMSLGDVAAVAHNLTLNSEASIAVAAIDLSGGTLTAAIDSDNDNVGATFQSTGALSAGSISITGSTAGNDDVTIGSTMTSTTGAIQFSKIDDLSLQGDTTAATNITFSNVDGPLASVPTLTSRLSTDHSIFHPLLPGILLAGSNGSINILTANGATG